MSRVRVYIKPLTAENTYAADWTEVTRDVLEESISSFTKALDNTEFDFGIYRISSGHLKLRNDHGKYAEVGEANSMFVYKRADSQVRITWDRANFDPYPNVGLLPHQIWPSNETDVFVGLITEANIRSSLEDHAVDFTISGRESLFERTSVPFDDVKARLSWTARTAPGGNTWNKVIWAEELGLFIAVGVGPVSSFTTTGVMTSPDGITWTARTTPIAGDWRSVVWSSALGMLAAVGATTGNVGAVITSTDGVNWTSRTVPNMGYRDICWSPELGMFAACCGSTTSNQVVTSTNGATWTQQTSPSGTASWQSICWAPEPRIFVAVGTTGTSDVTTSAMTSPDGLTWTLRTCPTNPQNGWAGVVWSSTLKKFIAFGGWVDNRVMTSDDGYNWNVPTTIMPSAVFRSPIWVDEYEMFVAGSNSSTFATSPDGVNWYESDAPGTNGYYSVAWSPSLGRFAAVGMAGEAATSDGGAFISNMIKSCLNRPKLTSVMTYDAAQVNPGLDVQLDIPTKYENKTVKELLQDLLLISNSVLVIEDDVMVVKPRTESADLRATFYGPGSTLGSENVIMIENIKEGTNRLFNYFTWKDTTLLAENAGTVSTYGVRKREISIESVTVDTTQLSILNELLGEFGEPKDEMTLIAPLSYATLAIGLLGKVNMDVPEVVLNGRTRSSFSRNTDQYYKVIQEKIDLKKDLIQLTLRRI